MESRELRALDEVLLTFEYGRTELGETYGRTTWVNDETRALLPALLLLDQGWDAVWGWLKSRRIPKNRAFVDKILYQAGLAEADTMGIIDACRGLSLNDSYWVVPEGFAGRWADYNLYDHQLDDVLSLVAYTGVTDSQRHAAGMSSEWTTSGSYPKAWRTVGGRPVLYQAGEWMLYQGTANSDLGPFSEYLSAQVAEAMGVPHVNYGLERWKGHLASTCDCFCSERVSFVTMWDACHVSGFLPMACAALAHSEQSLQSLVDIVTFDAVIANPDRHASNLGFMRDALTGEFIGPAPAFDQNKALFPTDMPSDYPTWRERSLGMYPAGSQMTFDEIMRLFQMPRQHELLRRLTSFKFEQHPKLRLPDDRVRALTSLVRGNTRHYLQMPVHSLGEVSETLMSSRTWDEQRVDGMPLMVEPYLLNGAQGPIEQARPLHSRGGRTHPRR